MKSFRATVAALLIGAALPAAAMTGCYASEGAFIVEDSPPPPREEVVVSRTGYVWVHGRWTRPAGGRWVWRGGYYERERPNATYVQGRWERRGRGHVYVDGTWRARGGVVIR